MDNLVVKGMSFADLKNSFIAKPVGLGKHTVVFKEFDFNKAFIPKNATVEVIPAVVVVDDETFTRTQNFTVQGTEILVKNAGRQQPALANQSAGGILTALVKEAIKLDMWLVANNKDGQTYYNWQFYQPVEAHDADVADAVANSLT